LIEKVGLIPIEPYIRNLDLRCYGRDMIIKYTKNIYDLDITEELKIFESKHGNLWCGNLNIFNEFEENNPTKEPDDKTREWFESKQKRRFLKFAKNREEFREDRLIPLFPLQDIHHIFPLMYGGSNKLLNLMYISKFSHNLLHKNTLENIEKYCYQACDYLAYLGGIGFGIIASGFNYLDDKYKLSNYQNNPHVLLSIYKGAIEEEMYKFYLHIQELEGIVQPSSQVNNTEVIGA
jgi:hypothetical protein